MLENVCSAMQLKYLLRKLLFNIAIIIIQIWKMLALIRDPNALDNT